MLYLKVENGVKYTIIPSTFKAAQKGPFFFKVACSSRVVVQKAA